MQQNDNYGGRCFVFDTFYRSIMRKKVKFIAYLTIPICFALLLTFTLGENYDGKSQKIRGAQRRPTRQVEGSSSSSDLDPFSNRPRIQTRNGHLVIEASPDKNIDFKTSGSRGTITINGHKLDQLLDVTKALERSVLSNGGKVVGLEREDGGLFVDSPASNQFDLVLRKLLDSSDKLLKFDKKISALQAQVNQLSKQVTKLSSRLSKQNKVVKKLDKKQETIETKLKRNDCFNSETGQPNCKNGATCVDAYDGFKCLCTDQYEGQTCEDDVDECSKFRGTDLGCQNGAKCVNFAGGYSCECSPQYHGIHCTEQHDDCSLSTSRSLCGHGKCINLARNVPNQARYECTCDQGWTTDGINPACVIDINECMVGQTTTTTNSSLTTNIQLVSTTWSNSLMAAYPCSQNPFVECINLLGSFECGPCPPGYTGNGRVCRDINECLTNNGGCSTSPLVECINTQGSHRCGFCPPGYTGDGVTCSRVSPCDIELNGGCHPMAKCVELNGVSMSTRFCICNYPLVGDGIGATGCSPTNKLGPIYDNNDGVRNGNDSTTINSILIKQQDDCDPNPCLNDAECKKTDSGFSCICWYGWKGKLCDTMDSTCGGRYYLNEGGFTFPKNGSFTEIIKNSFAQAGLGESSKSLDTAKISKHYDCLWSISVSPSSMSIQLKLANIINLNNQRKKIQYWLANSTTGHKIQTPTCSEYLDIREVLSDEATQNKVVDNSSSYKKKLLAKVCIDGRGGNLAYLPNNKRELVLFSESNTAEIEYSFSATRTQFGEPSLSFAFNWTKTDPPCGGSLDIAEFGSISSPKFPEFYQPGTECRYLIHVPNDKRIRVQFGELNLLTGRQQQQQQHPDSTSFTENCADSLTILDGSFGLDRPVLFKHCANNYTFVDKMQNPTPIISSSSTIELILNSQVYSTEPLMRPKQKRGFYLTYASEPTTPGCGGLYTAKSAIIKSTDYEADRSLSSASSLDDQRQILQLSHYLENVDSSNSFNVYTSPLYWSSSSDPLSARANSSEKFNTNYKQTYKVRCEYEIRPANQGRNHRISLDWLEMPRRMSTQNVGGNLLTFKSRKMQCSRNRLIVYDGNPLDNSNRTELATFCGGDKYNASSPLLVPIISSGHSLIIVYETTNDLFALDRNAQILTDAIGSNYPTGFKLRYSTVCTSIYYQTSGNIQVEIDDEVSECIYHIILPPNNTISLIIEQRISEQTMADGSCPAQAIFMDGAIQGGKLALIGAERQLKTYSFDQKTSNFDDITNAETRVGDTSSSSGVNGDLSDNTNSNSVGDTNSYWQYSNSGQSHDIKEFEVCSLSALSFDSVWNHLSLLFRLKQPTNSENKGAKIGKVNLVVRYQAEPSCGGIIDKPREGSFKLVSNQRISSISSFPLTANKYEQLHKQQFVNNCAWILKAPTNQQIQLKFDVPTAEIKKRFDEWLIWSKKQPKMKSNNSTAMNIADNLADSNGYLKSANSFNCAQVYEEVFELYEPSLNRTRYICPNDLNLATQDSEEATNLSMWSTQSNIVYVRVQNSSEAYPPSKNNSPIVWPGKKKLNESLITLNYKFVSSSSRQCGGRLIQDSGVITSPMYPYNYPSNSLCIWVIQTNPSQQIRLNFSKFEIEKQGACSFDFLELRNGPTSDSPLIGRFCNQDLQSRVIISHSNFLWLKFKSDTSLSRPGFEVYFDGAQTGCGGRLSSASGQIDSPNYPLPYAHSSDCKWTIEVVESSKIELTIQDLDLSNCRLNGTKTDFLEIFDSPLMSTNSLGRFCHKSQLINATIISSGNKLSLDFKSQALDNSRGFRITYKTYCNPIELTGFQGVIESPGYPTGYQAFSNCAWTIRAPLGSNLSIAITDLDLEDTTMSTTIKMQNSSSLAYLRDKCRDDFVEIYSIYPLGQNNSSMVKNYTALMESQKVILESRESKKLRSKIPKNGKLTSILCGQLSNITDNDRILVLDTNLVHINFESDRSVQSRGFRIEWTALGCGGLPEVKSDSHSSVSFHEQMSYQKRPTECLWMVDFSKSLGQIEISLDSDMRMPDLNKGLVKDSCEDASFVIYDGSDDKSPILFKNCDSQSRREIITSSNFQVLVKFYTSGQHNYGRGFNLDAFLTRRTSCLTSDFDFKTPFNQVGLVKKSPKYPDLYDSSDNSYNCFGLVSGRRNSRIKFTIDELDIPINSDNENLDSTLTNNGLIDPITCRKSGNYFLIKTSMSENHEEIYCGKLDRNKDKDLARSSIVMEEATVWEQFSAKGGFKGRWKISYTRLCGSLVWIEGQREFTTPDYPLRPNWLKSGNNEDELEKSENVCIWNLKTKSGQGKGKLYLNIINFIESDNKRRSNVDCLRIYEGIELNLKKSQFNLTEFDSKFTPKLKICKLSDIKYSSLQYISQSSELFVIISGNAIVKFRVKSFENGCGGEYNLRKSEFASLGYPEPYSELLDCHYFIKSTPGSRINLKFLDLDLPEGDDDDELKSTAPKCDNVDYVEVRQLSISKKLNLKLNPISSASYRLGIWSDSAFILEQMKRLKSYPTNTTTIKVANNINQSLTPMKQHLFDIAQLYYSFEELHSSESSGLHFSISKNSYFSLDNFYENSKLIGRFCGTKVPNFSNAQLFDEVLVRFRSHGNTSSLSNKRKVAPKGFLAEYEIQYGGLIQLIDKETMEDGSFISSPSYPAKIRFNNSIKWTFETKLDSILQFDLITLDLGSPHIDCIDSLNIYDGLNVKTSIRLSQTCGYFRFKSLQYFRKRYLGRWPPLNTGNDSVSLNINALPILEALNPKVKSNLIRSVRTSSNVATIIYDNFKSEGLFLLRYKAINKKLSNEQRNSSSYSDENYIIDENEVILDEKQDLVSNNNNNPQNASKLCSNTYQLNMWHENNSSGGKNNKTSSQSAGQVALFSPNYPQRPKQAIECHWLIYTPDDTIINLSIDPSSQNDSGDRLTGYDREHCSDFNKNTNLYQAYIVIHDGASRLSPIIARFCLPAPPKQISSSGRHMLIRYMFNNLNQLTNADDSSSSSPNPNQPSSFLFKGRASVGQCGGQYHVSSVATISDRPPNSGTFYANNLDCKYYIFAASQDKVLTIYNSQSELELAKEPTNANCTIGDYIEIRDLPIQSEVMEFQPHSSQGRSLGRFCAGRKLEVIESPGSAIIIEFKTDSQNTAKGWELRVVSGDPYLSCPFGRNFIKFVEPFGRFTSPNWPHGLDKERHCQYGFEAPTNQSILITFIRLNRPSLGENGETNALDPLTKQKCADNFDYLADDEASLLYRFTNLRDLNSPISGTLLRDYVQQIPCKSSIKFDRNNPSNNVMKWLDAKNLEQQAPSNISPDDLASLLNIEGPGYKKISSDEYYRLIQQAPTTPFEIRTNSHVLLMDYQTNNLLPKQGFVAVYRAIDDRKFKCGGELTYQSSTQSTSSTSSPSKPSNYFESANFNQESQQNDEFIQCDWSLEAQPDKFSLFDRSLTFATEYSMVPTANLGNISNNYIVFQTLEIPPTKADKIVFNDNFLSPDIKEKSNELCGLNRLLIIDTWFSMPSLVACGNLTRKWHMLSYGDRKLSIRTKNLRYQQKEDNNNNLSIYRGVKGFLYEKNCLQVERIIGDGIRLRSHREYPNSSYTPGICRWRLQLDGGNYELSFDKIQFRPPENYVNKTTGTTTTICDTNNPDLDYIEIRATEYSDSPILARYCIYNQMNEKDKAIMLNMESYLVVTFVAGIKQLSAGSESFVNQTSNQPKQQQQVYGFDMEIIRTSNDTVNDFCRRDKRESIYWFIRSSVSYYYDTFMPSNLNFLYPKNVHCFVDISIEEGMKFNLTFRGVFDIEPSKDCKKDYIQIDDIITNQQATNSSSVSSSEIASNKTHLMFKRRNEPIVKFIGKWCGRTKPNGYFLSTSNSIRITFHSNEQIEGKGFTLVYGGINNNNSTNASSTSNISSSYNDGIDVALSKMF